MGFLSQFVESIDTLEIPELRQVLKRIIAHSEFFSLIYVRRSLHHVKEGGNALCGTLSVQVTVISETGNNTRLVMVTEENTVPAYFI